MLFKKCLSYIYFGFFLFVLIAQNTKIEGWAVLPKLYLPSGAFPS